MVERTRAATYEDLLHVVELLEREHVEYALIGGYALALQGQTTKFTKKKKKRKKKEQKMKKVGKPENISGKPH